MTNPHVGALYGRWESRIYVRSVDEPLAPPIDPYYGYRLLPPLIVRALPVAPRLGFVLVDYASLLGAAYCTWSILVHESCPPNLALVCAVLFLTFPCSTKWLLAFSSGGDAFYLFITALLLRCIQLRRWATFAVALVAGAFTKFSAVVLWPVALVYGTRSLREAIRARPPDLAVRLATIVPTLVVLALVRVVWPPTPVPPALAETVAALRWRVSVFGVTNPLESLVIHTRLKLFGYTNMLPFAAPQLVEVPVAFLIVFGVVGLLILRHIRQSARILAAHPAMFALLVGSIGAGFVGSFDSERCQMYAAIAVLYVFARLMLAHADVYGCWWAIAVLAGAQLYLSDLSRPDVTRIETYMSHYMRPEATVRYAAAWAATLLLLEIIRRRAAPGSTCRAG